MENTLKKLLPYVFGVIIAGIVYVMPEVKPFACGAGSLLPLFGGS